MAISITGKFSPDGSFTLLDLKDSDLANATELAASESGDFYPVFDTSTGLMKKIDHDNMPGGGGGSTLTDTTDYVYLEPGKYPTTLLDSGIQLEDGTGNLVLSYNDFFSIILEGGDTLGMEDDATNHLLTEYVETV